MANIDMETSFVSFLKDMSELRNSIKNEKSKLAPKFNITDTIGELDSEVNNSKLIKKLLEIIFTHDGKNISFAKLFIDYLNTKLDETNKIKYSGKAAVASKEVAIENGRRIDILIEIDDYAIIIENKINHSDSENQLNDYYNSCIKKKKKTYVLYLTRDGNQPNECSLCEKYERELGEKLIIMSHGDIGVWIEEDILDNETYFFIKDDDKKYKFLYSALIQIMENEKILSSISGEDNVEKELIEKHVNEFINKNNNVGNLNEFGDILKQSADVLYHKFYYDFYSKLINVLDKKFKGIEPKKRWNDEELSDAIQEIHINKNKKADAPIVIYPLESGDISGGIYVEIYRDACAYGLVDRYDGSERKKGFMAKLKKLNIEEKLEYELVEDESWSYLNYINEKTDSPEYIADKIYKLYKLLKDNGF